MGNKHIKRLLNFLNSGFIFLSGLMLLNIFIAFSYNVKYQCPVWVTCTLCKVSCNFIVFLDTCVSYALIRANILV